VEDECSTAADVTTLHPQCKKQERVMVIVVIVTSNTERPAAVRKIFDV